MFDPAITGWRDQVGHVLTYAEHVMETAESPADRAKAQKVWRQAKGLHRLLDAWRRTPGAHEIGSK